MKYKKLGQSELKVSVISMGCWAIAGARSPEQININIKAAELKLSSEVLEQLTLASKDLKKRLGSNPDMWQSDSRIR